MDCPYIKWLCHNLLRSGNFTLLDPSTLLLEIVAPDILSQQPQANMGIEVHKVGVQMLKWPKQIGEMK